MFATLTKNPQRELGKLYFNHLKEGYLQTSIDSVITNVKGKKLVAYIYLGKKANGGFSIVFTDEKNSEAIATRELPQIFNEIENRLTALENSGYPFAQIITNTLDSANNEFNLTLNKGPFIKIDSIIGVNSPVQDAYLRNYLSLKEGEPYNEQKIRELRKKINSSQFLKMSGYPSVIFVKNGAKLYLNLEEKKANRFDGIIGIQPGEDQRTSITGLVNLALINSLKRGEEISLNWERLLAQNQRLKINLSVPYLFKTKLGVAFQANIIRQDSILNRSLLDYKVFYDFSSRSRLSVGIETARNNTNISEQASFQNTSSTAYSLTYNFNTLDNVINPRSGMSFLNSALIGERRLANDEDVQLITISGRFNYFLPVIKKTAILFQVQGETLNSPDLFSNELIQVGGLNFIRGVDQRSINVSSWLTSTIEYRYLFDTSSNIFVFGESHWNEAKSLNGYVSDQISAFGIGISVGTKNGVFSFNYAVSNQAENTFLFRNAKINFGFSSSF